MKFNETLVFRPANVAYERRRQTEAKIHVRKAKQLGRIEHVGVGWHDESHRTCCDCRWTGGCGDGLRGKREVLLAYH